MKDGKENSNFRATRAFLFVLTAVLSLLFWKSFLPGLVHFSNDGPLGAQKASWIQLPQGFTGMWADVNSLGGAAGAYPPDINSLIRWFLGPVGYSKFLVPITLWLEGACAWFFFRRLGFTGIASGLGGLAVALNSEFLSNACWGIASQPICFGMNFLAMGLVASNASGMKPMIRFARLALAGLAIGVGVMEGADVGAIFSMLFAAFVVVESLTQDGPLQVKLVRGVGRTALTAGFAAFIAASTIISLISVQIKGVAGTQQMAEPKGEHWIWATQWSMPKKEALSVIIPGLFGFRMDTPRNMEMFPEAFEGGSYWGGVGRDPRLDEFFGHGIPTNLPPGSAGSLRFMGNGFYAGVPVVLIAVWAALQAFRGRGSVFNPQQRKMIWFWSAVAFVALLLSFGRFAPFYQFVYALPYFSNIRNPIKYMHVVSFAVLVVFGYGVDGLYRWYMEPARAGLSSWTGQVKAWWSKASAFDRRWVVGCALALGFSLFAWMIYDSYKESLQKYITAVQLPEPLAPVMAAFSISQVGWFVLALFLSVGLLFLILSGVFSGSRAKVGGILLGVLLVLDLGRANLPWIIYWDYHDKYSSNPVIDYLRNKPYESRVSFLPAWFQGLQLPSDLLSTESLAAEMYRIEWTQHHFLFYDIQSLDVIQQPRMPQDLAAFETAFRFDFTPKTLPLITRRWELTNTRYLLGAAGFLDFLNQQFDPVQHRFRIVMRFDIVPKPGLTEATYPEELTAKENPQGKCALIEFTGALPRAKLFTQWQTSTNDRQTLDTLASPQFDPLQKVLVADAIPAPGATNSASPGTVDYTSYTPKKFVLQAKAEAPSVLLVNDRFDPNWKVWVDGKPEPLLRCNFIMRGVAVPPGTHTVEFRFQPPIKPLYVSLAAIGFGILLVGFLAVAGRKGPPPVEPEPKQAPQPATAARRSR